jgi:hypothetical protein
MSRPTSWAESLLTVRKPGRGEEEKDMFTTDSFLGAEITYRQDRIRKDYGHHRWTRVRTDDTQK